MPDQSFFERRKYLGWWQYERHRFAPKKSEKNVSLTHGHRSKGSSHGGSAEPNRFWSVLCSHQGQGSEIWLDTSWWWFLLTVNAKITVQSFLRPNSEQWQSSVGDQKKWESAWRPERTTNIADLSPSKFNVPFRGDRSAVKSFQSMMKAVDLFEEINNHSAEDDREVRTWRVHDEAFPRWLRSRITTVGDVVRRISTMGKRNR